MVEQEDKLKQLLDEQLAELERGEFPLPQARRATEEAVDIARQLEDPDIRDEYFDALESIEFAYKML